MAKLSDVDVISDTETRPKVQEALRAVLPDYDLTNFSYRLTHRDGRDIATISLELEWDVT